MCLLISRTPTKIREDVTAAYVPMRRVKEQQCNVYLQGAFHGRLHQRHNSRFILERRLESRTLFGRVSQATK